MDASHAAIPGGAAVESDGGLAGDGAALSTYSGDALDSGVTERRRPAQLLDGLARWLTGGKGSPRKKSTTFVAGVMCCASNERWKESEKNTQPLPACISYE